MTPKKLFGTDGIRGRFGEAPFTPEVLDRLAQAVGLFIKMGSTRAFSALIALDTRFSSPLIQEIFVKRFQRLGISINCLSVLPTPALAHRVKADSASLGMMISASHNPFEDNGIKFFNSQGDKLSDHEEETIERIFAELTEVPVSSSTPFLDAPSLDGENTYKDFLLSTLPKRFSLRPLKIVIDCAHGAGFRVGPDILRSLGGDVISLADTPNGRNINAACGALHPQLLQQTVRESGADVGIALDGDGDRLLLVDNTGTSLDGDQVLALLALQWQKEGRLPIPEIVSTVMANGAFEHFLRERGIRLLRTPVGDRYIATLLKEKTLPLGGEPSGHVILREFSTSGDGLLTALQVLRIVLEVDQPLRTIFPLFHSFPQLLQNIPLPSGAALTSTETLEFLERAQKTVVEFGGRLLVRPSGTEPLLRIFVEGRCQETIEKATRDISDFFRQ